MIGMMVPSALAESDYSKIKVKDATTQILEFDKYNVIRISLTVENDDSEKFQYSDAEIDYVNYLKTVDVLGSADDVGQKLRARAERYAVDEFFLLTTTYNFTDRIRSYELIAEEFQLTNAVINEHSI